jgi:adenylate cyclase
LESDPNLPPTPGRPRGRFALIRQLSARIIGLGAHHARTAAETRWIRTINIVGVAAVISNLSFIFAFALIDPKQLAPVIQANVVAAFAYMAVIAANGTGYPRLASWLFLATAWSNVLSVMAAFGGYTGPYLFLLLVPLLAALFSGPGDRILATVAITLGVGLFAAAPLIFTTTLLEGTTELRVMTVAGGVVVGLFGALVMLYYRRLVDRTETELEKAYALSDRLLLNILPAPIADRLKADESRIADRIDEVALLFADLVDSTRLADLLTPVELIELLDQVFSHFDDLADRFGVEKIAMIGDGYLAAAGAPIARVNSAAAAADMALAMLESLPRFTARDYGPLRMRIGLHVGPVIAGVIGRRKFRYDIWGDTVNTASRMESHGQPGRIHISAAMRAALGERYLFEPRGAIAIKGKGTMETYFLLARRSTSADTSTASG